MTTSAISAHGTLLKMYDRATHLVAATIGEVGDIKGPKIKGVRSDATTHSSGGWVEKISVLKDGGTLTFDVNFIAGDATHNKTTGLVAASLAQTKEKFSVTFPDASGFEFWALVDSEFSAKVKDKLSASIELDVTGAITAI